MIDVSHAALLVIDMQEFFHDTGSKVLANINSTIAECRSSEVPIIFTQHGHKYGKLDSGVLLEFWGSTIHVGSREWKFISGLDVKNDDINIEKSRYDAFYGTILNDILRRLKVDTVIISGVMTNMCCETTARSAFCHDYRVIFLSDGCATSSEALHNATLMNIEIAFGKVITCKKICELVHKKK
ncbi:isochorismatase family domain-containing protein [Ditylenchus destructor]|nr:isochorismatase family domain-containing protein [Ditylenchus destructor]